MPSQMRGFTLIEMALTVLVVGIVAAGAVGLVGPLRNNERAVLTGKRLDVAQKAIALYVIQNGCLPCPGAPGANSAVGADNAGRARNTAGIYVTATVKCTALACLDTTGDTGVLPWRDLGLSEDDATDGWGNRLRYAAAGSSTTASSCGTPVAGALQHPSGMMRVPGIGGCYPAGNISVNDTDPPTGTLTSAAYVVFSNGSDGSLAHRAGPGTATGNRWTQVGTDGQFENSDGDAAFVTGAFNDNANTTHFDDLMRYTTAPVLIQLCGPNACGNPS